MTYEQYWYADPYLPVYYRKAHELAMQERSQQMWLQGLYNYRAFAAVMEMIEYRLGGKKGKRPEGYVKEPFDVFKKPDVEEEHIPTEEEVWKAQQTVINQLNSWAKKWKKNTQNKSGDINGS